MPFIMKGYSIITAADVFYGVYRSGSVNYNNELKLLCLCSPFLAKNKEEYLFCLKFITSENLVFLFLRELPKT